jgi:putative MATE family efflux protein
VALAMSLLAIAFAEQLAGFFRLEDDSRVMAVSFIRWTCLFAPSQAIVMVLSTACRSVGDARTPLFLGVFANGISIFGAWVFAYGHFGLPAMGVSGAAIGWGLAFTFSAVAYLTLWIKRLLKLPYYPAADQPQTSLRHFINISMPATIEQFIMQAAMLLFIVFVASYGTAAFAAYGVGMSLFSVAAVIGLGFSIASSALVGQSLGAGNPEAALASAREALKLSLGIMVITGGLSALFATPIAAAMVDDPAVIELTAQFLVALALLQPMLAADFVLTGAMRGAGDTRFPLIAGLVAVVGVRLPLGAIIAWQQLPIIWIYAVFIVDQAVKLIIVFYRYRARRWLHTLAPGAQ